MEVNNNKLDNNSREFIDSSQLSYVDNSSRGKSISKMTDNSPIDRSYHFSNVALALMFSSSIWGQVNNNNGLNSKQQSIFNINLLYNVNQTINQDLWDVL